ncbi:uncharacterized protein LOC122397871 [Colletes gigas]|uniref:uncharacterized protein LOC122397871 n=1 Tax=Colletes gigas TaxID=935657 RepID=UPI001C9B62A5|nr:uncharacterized protein LOC122397871 [Colletes gigas]
MSEFENLSRAIKSLNKSVSNFPVGAVSLDDYTPIEERISNMRELLQFLNARLIMLKTHHESATASNATDNEFEEDMEHTITHLHEETANFHITNKAFKLCLHTEATQAILEAKDDDQNMQKKICALLCQLYILNDKSMLLQAAIEDSLQKQLDLKIQCQNALFDYQKFLKTEEDLLSQKLQETNPEVAQNKKKAMMLLQKINLMKKLIVNLIPPSNKLIDKPFLLDLLADHRDLITMEGILKKSQSNKENINGNEDSERNRAK